MSCKAIWILNGFQNIVKAWVQYECDIIGYFQLPVRRVQALLHLQGLQQVSYIVVL